MYIFLSLSVVKENKNNKISEVICLTMSDIKTSKKQVGFLEYPTMNNSLENSIIVQKFSIQLIPHIPRRSSISEDHSSIKTKHSLLPPIHHNKGRILSPINNNIREKLNNQKTSENLNGTINITENRTEFHTIETEKKINENQETLNLLNKIKESPTAALIGPMPLSQQVYFKFNKKQTYFYLGLSF
jgi:hypothetical protein